MNKLSYLLSKVFYFFFGFDLVIFKPRKTKSLRTLPTTFRIEKSKRLMFVFGTYVLLAGFFGGIYFGLELEPYSLFELWGFLVIEMLLILAFINQLMLKGEVHVSTNTIKFSYRSIFGRIEREEDISAYKRIWVQRYRIRGNFNGTRYHVIYLQHRWSRFRTLNFYRGNEVDERADFYSNLFNLPINKSIITIIK